jgi:Flp pilus assembly protein CpaB
MGVGRTWGNHVMSRRTLLMISSILLAAIGTALIGLYVRQVEVQAQRRLAGVEVLMATRTIPRGMLVSEAWEQGAMAARMMAAEYAAGALPVADLNANMGQYLTHTVFSDTVIRSDMLGRSLTRHQDLTQGMGITVELRDPNRAVGMLTPGDQVTVFVTRNSESRRPVVQIVLKRVTVVSIGGRRTTGPSPTSSSTSATEEVSSAIVGLDVSRAQVIAVRRAEVEGELSFAVIRPPATPSPSNTVVPKKPIAAP